jgi:hypothetical protein
MLRNPATNKSRGFSREEVSSFGLRGILPAGEPLSLQQQVRAAYNMFFCVVSVCLSRLCYGLYLYEIWTLLPRLHSRPSLQVEMVMATLRRQKDDLCRYEVLSRLGTSDTNLFYAVLTSHLGYTLPLVYTPTVGQVCPTQYTPTLYIYPHGLPHPLRTRGWRTLS